MRFEIETAKNGEQTLKINDKYIYSKYAPIKDAQNFILKEFDNDASGYILVGLGLGYHLEKLLDLTNKEVVLLPLGEKDIEFYLQFTKNSLLDNISLLDGNNDLENYQILIPNAFLSAVGEQHPLYDYLQDIKIRQRSYKTYGELLERNFKANICLNDPTHELLANRYKGERACLISAGPSLDDLLDCVALARSNGYYILSVGSALKSLLAHNIIPDAVIITDSQDNIQQQLMDTNYNGILYYLSTANYLAVQLHPYERIMLLQEGYDPVEKLACKENLLETGGSVATTAFSLLEYMGFQQVILFGQDLGFAGDYTHSKNSTSLKKRSEKQYRQILSNANTLINTQPNLYSYLRWFEHKFSKTNVSVINTALLGAKIKGTTFLNPNKLELFINGENSCI